MKEKIEVKRNIINIDKNLNEIDTYIYPIIKNLLNTSESLEIKKETNNLYKVYINNTLYCKVIIDSNVIMYEYMLKIIFKDKTYTYYVDYEKNNLVVNMHEYSYKKDNKEYYVNKYYTIHEGVIIDRNNKITLIIEDKLITDNKFNNILENINFLSKLEEIYNELNKYERIKIVKSRLINNKTDELVTDIIKITDNNLEELKLTINKEDKKYIIEKTGNNYTITYINSSVCEIKESYFTITDNMNFIKKLEKKKLNNN